LLQFPLCPDLRYVFAISSKLSEIVNAPKEVDALVTGRFRIPYHAGLALILGGCTYWQPYTLPAQASPTHRLPSSLRTMSPNGRPLVLVHPFIKGDTLFGRVGRNTLGVPYRTVSRIERPRVDGLRTLGLVAGGSAAWIAVGLYGGGLE
jgi:hypothetical protein